MTGVDVFPASFAQERIWFLSQFEPTRAVYNLGSLFSLEDYPRPFDPERFEQAFAAVVQRHESLRTGFALEDAGVMQVVHPSLEVNLPVVELRGTELDRVAAEAMELPVPLDQAPLWRAQLIRTPPDDWQLLWVCHHAIADATSFGILQDEMLEHYRALVEDRAPEVPDLPIQYADYSVWQRQQLDGPALAERIDHWRVTLEATPDDTGLATDRPRPRTRSSAGDDVHFSLTPELSEQLATLARQAHTTLFSVAFAGFQALVARWTGRDDVVIGCLVAGREQPEVADLIGMFVNPLVLRTDLAGEPTFRELVGRTTTTVADALDHQDLPFEKLVGALRPDRDPSRPPLFQLGFNMLPVSSTGQLRNHTAKFDLMIELHDTDGQIRGWVEHSTDLFDRATIERLVTGYQELLGAAAADPDTRISRLPVVPAEERRRLLAQASGPEVEVPAAGLHELVAAQADRTPDAVAVVGEDGSLTFRQLQAAARALAERLGALGVTTGTPVGVHAERSPELIVALLAVLQAGGAYLPLDPEQPPQRLRFMVEDAGAPIVLVQPHLRGGLTVPDAVDLVDVSLAALPPSGADGVAAQVGGDDLAYVIYTSGSTGTPKGVANTHRAVVNTLDSMRRDLRIGPEDSYVLKTPIGFDVAGWELWLPLVTGGRLVLARPGGHRDPGYLRDLVVDHGVTTMVFVPSMLGAFLAEPGVDACRSLQRVLCIGEPLPPELAQRGLDRLGAEVHNLYGPTEAAIHVSTWRCQPGADQVPIGFPIQNTHLHVLDAALEPLPVGVPGELFIGGAGLARGYAGRPRRTAESFVPDPHGAPGDRLYRTGDLARRRADGALVFCGRIDSQVKIRGMRVELAEIEAALRAQPGVVDAAARLWPGGRLAAYLVGIEPDATALRASLRQALPDYMVPTDYVALDTLPTSVSGKLDRDRLPAPSTSPEVAGTYVAPSTPLETELCAMWAELLDRDRVGVGDDFFALGGHSLLVVRLVALIRDGYGVDLPLSRCFEITTVADYAVAILEAQLGDDDLDDLLALIASEADR